MCKLARVHERRDSVHMYADVAVETAVKQAERRI